jgi:hypothetical protein
MSTIPFEAVIGPLSAALGLSVVVERVLAFFKNYVEPRIGASGTREAPKLAEGKKQMEDLAYSYELSRDARDVDSDPQKLPMKLADLEGRARAETDPAKRSMLLEKIKDLTAAGEWDEQFPAGKILVLPATDVDDGTTLRAFILQLLGFVAGIVLARTSGVGVFTAFLDPAQTAVPSWDYALTGLLIGGGSAPLHLLIQFITERKMPSEAREPVSEEKKAAIEEAPGAPAVIVPPGYAAAENWVDIPYFGGVDRDLLEDLHRRTKDPDMVVYHHTAMSSRSTFEDVVQVIKSRTDSRGKKWLTGYNCVILADGSVHAFCRWDRYGSHAVGYNQRSLGITFNGNFETDPKVPFSNPNGKYGPARPTDEQVKAGARVVALWTFLYPGIKPDFEKTIIPHKQIANKTCPGNMFPYDEFKRLVDFYRKQWERSSFIKERIEAFRQKPYLFVKEGRP